MKSKTINELRKVIKEFGIKQPKGCNKEKLIRLLNKEKKKFIDEPKNRSEIKKIFDSLGLRFDKNDFKPKEEKNINQELNLKRIFTPKCYVCGKPFKVDDYEHIKNCKIIKSSKQKEKCMICGKYYKIKHIKNHISSREHKKALKDIGNEEIKEYETAYKSRLRSYRINNLYNVKSILEFLEEKRNIVVEKIRQILQEYNGIKVNLKLFCRYEMRNQIQEFSFKTENVIILRSNDLNTFYDFVIDKLINESDEFIAKGSGWSLIEIRFLELRINKYDPLRGSSYVDLPDIIKNKKAIINVKNSDNKCFMWSILSAIHPIHLLICQ